jgi:protein-tyrosine phosphatase
MSRLHPIWSITAGRSQAKIGLTPYPGTKDADVIESLIEFRRWGASAILSLLPKEEMEKLNTGEIESHAKKAGMIWLHLPLPDNDSQQELIQNSFEEHWQAVTPFIHQLLDDNKSVIIHCRRGSSRTGLVAIRLQLERGVTLAKATEEVISVRPSALEPQAHLAYINYLHENLSLTISKSILQKVSPTRIH